MNNKWIRIGSLILGVPAIILAGWYAYRDLRQLEAPPLWALLPAGLANLGSLWCSSRSWEVLFGEEISQGALRDAFYTSQLMKYTPVGGVAQAVGQAALARTDEVDLQRAATAMVVSKLTMVIAGGAFGPLVALTNSTLPGWVRIALLSTPAVVVFGNRSLLAWTLERLRKVLPRMPDRTILPSQRDVWVSVAWAVPGLGFAGVAFAALAIPAGLGVGFVQAFAGFALAWVVGFIVIPVPAGLGVREASLGLLVAGNPGSKLVAAVLFRVVAIGTEAILFGSVKLTRRRSRQARSPRRPDPR